MNSHSTSDDTEDCENKEVEGDTSSNSSSSSSINNSNCSNADAQSPNPDVGDCEGPDTPHSPLQPPTPCSHPHSSDSEDAESRIEVSSEFNTSRDVRWCDFGNNLLSQSLNDASNNGVIDSDDNLDHSFPEYEDAADEIMEEVEEDGEGVEGEEVIEDEVEAVEENVNDSLENFEFDDDDMEMEQEDMFDSFFSGHESEDTVGDSDHELDNPVTNRLGVLSSRRNRRGNLEEVAQHRRTSERVRERNQLLNMLNLRLLDCSARMATSASSGTELNNPPSPPFETLENFRNSCPDCNHRTCRCRVAITTTSSASSTGTTTTTPTITNTTSSCTMTSSTTNNDNRSNSSGPDIFVSDRCVYSPPPEDLQDDNANDNSILGRNSGNNWSSRTLADNVLSDLSRSYASGVLSDHRTLSSPLDSDSESSSSSVNERHGLNENEERAISAVTAAVEGQSTSTAETSTSPTKKIPNLKSTKSNNLDGAATNSSSVDDTTSAHSRSDVPALIDVFALPTMDYTLASMRSTLDSYRNSFAGSRRSRFPGFSRSLTSQTSAPGRQRNGTSSTNATTPISNASSSDVCGASGTSDLSSTDSVNTGNGDSGSSSSTGSSSSSSISSTDSVDVRCVDSGTSSSSSTDSVNTRSSNSETISEVSGLESLNTASASNACATSDSGDAGSSRNVLSSGNNEAPQSTSNSGESFSKSPDECKSGSHSPKAESRRTPDRSEDPSPSKSPPGSPNSEETCSICLGVVTDACVAGSCLHRFCFPCLKEWANRKAVCPLCKKSFTIIIHDIKGERDYKEYQVPVQPSFPLTSFLDDAMLFFSSNAFMRYSRQRSGFQLNRNFILPSGDRHSRRAPRIPPNSERALTNRRRIYHEDLWVRFTTHERVRESNPSIYRSQPALTHRLAPWLLRELRALRAPTHLMPRIMQLITRFSILSRSMTRAMNPFIRHYTQHFLHEFNCFAHSSYDMVGYDTAVAGRYGSYEARVSPPLDVNLEDNEDDAHDMVEIDLTNDTTVEVSPAAAGTSQASCMANSRATRTASALKEESVIVSSDDDSSSAPPAAVASGPSEPPGSSVTTTPAVSDDHDYHRRNADSNLARSFRQYRQLMRRIRDQETGRPDLPSVSTTVNIGLEAASTNNISLELHPNTQLTLTARSVGGGGGAMRRPRETTVMRAGVPASFPVSDMDATFAELRSFATPRRTRTRVSAFTKEACEEAKAQLRARERVTRVKLDSNMYGGALKDFLQPSTSASGGGPSSSSTSRRANSRNAVPGDVASIPLPGSSGTAMPKKKKAASSNLMRTVIVSSSSSDDDSCNKDGGSAAPGASVDSDECLIVDERNGPAKVNPPVAAGNVVSIVLSDSSDADNTPLPVKPKVKSTQLRSLLKKLPKLSKPVKLDRDSFQLNVKSIPSPTNVAPALGRGTSLRDSIISKYYSLGDQSSSQLEAGPSGLASASRDRDTSDSESEEEVVREPKDDPSRIKSSSVKHKRNPPSHEPARETSSSSCASQPPASTAPKKGIRVRLGRLSNNLMFPSPPLSPDTESYRIHRERPSSTSRSAYGHYWQQDYDAGDNPFNLAYSAPLPASDLRYRGDLDDEDAGPYVPHQTLYSDAESDYDLPTVSGSRLPSSRLIGDTTNTLQNREQQQEFEDNDNDSIDSLRRRLLSSPSSKNKRDGGRQLLTTDDDTDEEYRRLRNLQGTGETSGLFINVARVARHVISDDSDNALDTRVRSSAVKLTRLKSPSKRQEPSLAKKTRGFKTKKLPMSESPPPPSSRRRAPSPHPVALGRTTMSSSRSAHSSGSRFENLNLDFSPPPPSSYKRAVQYEAANSSSDSDGDYGFGGASKKPSKRIKISVSTTASNLPPTSKRARDYSLQDSSTSLDDSSSQSDWSEGDNIKLQPSASKHSSSSRKKLKKKKKKKSRKSSKSRRDRSRERTSSSKKTKTKSSHGSSCSRKRSRHDSE